MRVILYIITDYFIYYLIYYRLLNILLKILLILQQMPCSSKLISTQMH